MDSSHDRILYNKASERLWEKLEFYRDKINSSTIDVANPLPLWDQFVKANPEAEKWANEVEKELDYSMLKFQQSFAVVKFLVADMEKYNRTNGTSLKPRV
jgi:hypothetical protein